MSRKFKSHASSARAASNLGAAFGSSSAFQTTTSSLSYVNEAPDLSHISDPNVVVAFKNLSKKDSTTKTKALEDLHGYCSSSDTYEQAFLIAWAAQRLAQWMTPKKRKDLSQRPKGPWPILQILMGYRAQIMLATSEIYPRTSIDNARRVRQLAHLLQGTIVASSGKRIAPLLPKTIGPWLAGTFDSDKTVNLSATDALQRAFSTPEKRNSLWNVYTDSLYAYVEDAVTVQTKSTLSDDRSTSPDEADAKYVRVLGTGIHILAELVKEHADHSIAKDILSLPRIWEFVYNDDAYLRRELNGITVVASQRCPTLLDWSILSSCFLSKALHSNQVGSSRQFVDTLIVLTRCRPELWTSDYTAKTPPGKRFLQFLRKGSQNGPASTWLAIGTLIKLIPEDVWHEDGVRLDQTRLESRGRGESYQVLIEALRSGIIQPFERINAKVAWEVYVETSFWIAQTRISSDTDRSAWAQRNLEPLILQYVYKSKDSDLSWDVASHGLHLAQQVIRGLFKTGLESVLANAWIEASDRIITAMKISLPESSKDYHRSQDAVTMHAGCFFELRKEVWNLAKSHETLHKVVSQAEERLMDESLQLLKARNGKPYGAAAIVEMIIRQPSSSANPDSLQQFLADNLSLLLETPSSERMAIIALICGKADVVDTLLLLDARCSKGGLRSQNSHHALTRVLQQVKSLSNDNISYLKIRLQDLGNEDAQDIALAILHNPELSFLHKFILQVIQATLDIQTSVTKHEAILTFLQRLTSSNTSASLKDVQAAVMSQLLLLSESDLPSSEQATALVNRFNSKSNIEMVTLPVLQQQLQGESAPLSILTLINLGAELLQQEKIRAHDILPTEVQWESAIIPHLSAPRPLSLTITSPLGGVLFYTSLENQHRFPKNSTSLLQQESLMRDADGYSQAFRFAMYVIRLCLNNETPSSKFSAENRRTIQVYLPFVLELINEKITIEDANTLWLQSNDDIVQEAGNVLSDGKKLVQSWFDDEDFLDFWLEQTRPGSAMLNTTLDTNLQQYYQTLAWTSVAANFIDRNGPSRILHIYDAELKRLSSNSPLENAALFAALKENVKGTVLGKKLVNELVAQATDAKDGDLVPLVLFNILLHGASATLETIPPQRLVFLMKSLVALFLHGRVPGTQAEAAKALVEVLPHVADIYGEHWEDIMFQLTKVWTAEVDLPLLHSTLRLYNMLQRLLNSSDVNDDLADAWKSSKADINHGLLESLHGLRIFNLVFDQPRDITAGLLRRLLAGVELGSDNALLDLLSSPVEALQLTAFEVLCRVIPHQQEQLSLDVVLEHRDVHLPEDLLSLTEQATSESQYMMVWFLIFEHFPRSSFKLREAYTADLKKPEIIGKLLLFICDRLNIAESRPVDPSKLDFEQPRLDDADTGHKQVELLAVSNYYRCLRYLPSLSKDWYLDQKNRIKIPLESWTAKYISTSIIAHALAEVNEWAAAQATDAGESALSVKSSPRGTELVASIEIDPENPPIALSVSLPASYPLESPAVVSRTRVGVSDKNWQSWLRTFQIIIFSTGSIIEGLVAFRRNVQGALKGQSECAICYSIIGTDMQTPNKKCGTCKNNFHAVCLYRWFKSSNSSSCPLCRNNFNYA